ncbi:MAG: hypothetical protein WB698_02305 [Solirubrobacteraceae bacterium]
MADPTIDDERSPVARARAERALCTLAAHIADDNIPLIVLGGLMPEILTEGRETGPSHLGTSDVDMLLVAHLEQTDRLTRIEAALEVAGFSTQGGENAWRWRGIVDGFAVKLEFLCDLDTEPEGIIAIPGCRVLRANNLRGTGYVAADWTVRELTADLAGLGPTTVRVRFAGLQGYLLTKCVAVRYRGKDKDHYDLVFVLIHNRVGGPSAAARQLLDGKLADRLPALRSTFLEVRERFYSVTSPGPKGFAAESSRADPSARQDENRALAVAAVNEFIEDLLAGG